MTNNWRVSATYRARAEQSRKRRRRARDTARSVQGSSPADTIAMLRKAARLRERALAWCRDECPGVEWAAAVPLGRANVSIGVQVGYASRWLSIPGGRDIERRVRFAARELARSVSNMTSPAPEIVVMLYPGTVTI